LQFAAVCLSVPFLNEDELLVPAVFVIFVALWGKCLHTSLDLDVQVT